MKSFASIRSWFLVAGLAMAASFNAAAQSSQAKDFSITVSEYGPYGGTSMTWSDVDYDDDHYGHGPSRYGYSGYGYDRYGYGNRGNYYGHGYGQPRAFGHGYGHGRRHHNEVWYYPADVWCHVHRAHHIHIRGDQYGAADWRDGPYHGYTRPYGYRNYGFVPNPPHNHQYRYWRRW